MYVLRDQAGVMGRLAYDLGNAYLYAGPRLQNSSVLFQMLVFADQDLSHLQVEGLSFESLERTLTYIDGVIPRTSRQKSLKYWSVTDRKNSSRLTTIYSTSTNHG